MGNESKPAYLKQAAKLDGFRAGATYSLRHRVSQAMNEAESENSLERDMILGAAAQRVIGGMASNEDLKLVIRQIIVECEYKAMESMRELSNMADLTSDDAKAAHYELRVQSGIMTLIAEMIERGVHSGRKIEEEGEQ